MKRAKTSSELLASMKPSIVLQEAIGPVDMKIRLKMTTTDHDFDSAAVTAAYVAFRSAVVNAVIVREAVPA